VRRTMVAVSLLALAGMPSAHGTVIRVDWEGAGDHTTIQEGLDAASEGDTVLVSPGTYIGPLNRALDFGGTNLKLVSLAGPEYTTIDCQSSGRGFRFHTGEDTTSVVDGFTVRNGSANQGGGARCDGSSPTIRNCVFRGNYAGGAGAGVHLMNAAPHIDNCLFVGNWGGVGAGLRCEVAAPATITNSTFYGNNSGSNGGGIHCGFGGSDPTIRNCTVVANHADGRGSGIHCGSGSPTVTNTIVAHSTGNYTAIECGSGNPSFTYCCVYGNQNGDALCGTYQYIVYEDPTFCALADTVLTLRVDSPCLPEGNDWGELIGAAGAGCGWETRLYVDCENASGIEDGSEAHPYDTIQEGIDACTPGDTLTVAPCIYTGSGNKNLDFHGVNLVLRSSAGRDSTIIDCEGVGRGLHFHTGEDSTSVVDGFTVRNGSAGEGGGVVCDGSSPTIRNCVFRDNYAGGAGAGAYLIDAAPRIDGCLFIGNWGGVGAGLRCQAAAPATITNSTFYGNSGSSGGGIHCGFGGSDPTIRNCTVVANHADGRGSGINCGNGSPTVTNTIVAFSTGTDSAVECGIGNPSFAYCCVFGNEAGDVLCGTYHDIIYADPTFCDTEGDVFWIQDGSPCEGAGEGGEDIGAWAVNCPWGDPSWVDAGSQEEPGALALHPARPNPLAGSTSIAFEAPSDGTRVSLRVYDPAGRLVRTIVDEVSGARRRSVVWDGNDTAGRRAAPGIYFVRLEAGGEVRTGKVCLLR